MLTSILRIEITSIQYHSTMMFAEDMLSKWGDYLLEDHSIFFINCK